MNYMEMFLALCAVVLFTSLSLVYNRSMWDKAKSLDDAAKVMQATQLAHSRLDEIDAKLFSKQLAFANIITTFTGTQQVTMSYTGYRFTLTYNGSYCDSLGVPTSIPNNLFVKMTVTVTSSRGMPFPVVLSRVYTKTNLNI